MDGFQLKAADFRHCHRIFCRLTGDGRIGNANIPHNKYFIHIVFHNVSGQRGGCRLSIGSRNRNQPSLCITVCQLHLAPDLYAPAAELLHKFRIHRHSGTDNHQIRPIDCLCGQCPCIDLCMQLLWQFLCNLSWIQILIAVKDRYICTICPHFCNQFCGTDTADAGADYQHMFSFQFHGVSLLCHIYKAIRPTRHKMAVTMENTATTRVSDHPHSSK